MIVDKVTNRFLLIFSPIDLWPSREIRTGASDRKEDENSYLFGYGHGSGH
jgi:hypothetical protein